MSTHALTRLTFGSAFLAALALGTSIHAQEREAPRGGDAPAARTGAPAQEAGQRERPAQAPAGETSAERGAAQRPAADAGTPAAGAAGRNLGMSEEQALQKMALEESKHRERLAKIERLRELAQSKNQAERLAQLDDLQRKENARYEQMMARGRQELGDERFRAAQAKLAHGRVRTAAAGGPADERGNPRGEQARHEEVRKDQAEADKDKGGASPDRPSQSGERPQADRGGNAPRPQADRGGNAPRAGSGGNGNGNGGGRSPRS